MCHAFDGPASLLFSSWCRHVRKDRLWWWLHLLSVTQQYRLASMAARLSSTGICNHSLLPYDPLIRLSAVNSSPCPGIAPQSLTPALSCCSFQGTCVPVRGMYDWGKDCVILIPFRLLQMSCFTLSLKHVSSDLDNCPNVGIRPLQCRLQFPHLPRAGPILLTLLFFPLFLYLPSFVWFYIFLLLVRFSCLLSAGVLHTLLCLKVYSSCIHGDILHVHLLLFFQCAF